MSKKETDFKLARVEKCTGKKMGWFGLECWMHVGDCKGCRNAFDCRWRGAGRKTIAAQDLDPATAVPREALPKGPSVLALQDVQPPKRPPTAYSLFVAAKRNCISEELGTKDRLKVSERASELWKETSQEDKAPFESQAEDAKQEYLKAKEEYDKTRPVKAPVPVSPDASTPPPKRTRVLAGSASAESDERAPKRPPSAYFLFLTEKRQSIFEELGEKNMCKASKRAGEMWKEVAAEQRSFYESQAAAAKEEYIKAKEAHEKEHPKSKKITASAQARPSEESCAAPVILPSSNLDTPSKKASAAGKRRQPAATAPDAEKQLNEAWLSEAGDLAPALRNLMARPEAVGRDVQELLDVLRANGGLVNKAKAALSAPA